MKDCLMIIFMMMKMILMIWDKMKGKNQRKRNPRLERHLPKRRRRLTLCFISFSKSFSIPKLLIADSKNSLILVNIWSESCQFCIKGKCS